MEIQIAGDDLRLLETAFMRRGIAYRQRFSGETFRVYGCQLGGDGREWFEVFQYRINAAHEIQGNKIGASEAFPPDSAFGTWAFTFASLQEAISRGEQFPAHKSASEAVA